MAHVNRLSLYSLTVNPEGRKLLVFERRTQTMNHSIRIVTIGLVLTLTFAGCNTIRGLGKDIEHGGQRIQDASEK